MMKKKIIPFFLAVIFMIGNSSFYIPDQSDAQEYILKAAFLYRFTDYVEWAGNNDEQNFTVIVLGESGITAPLNEIARDKKVKGKSMYIKESLDANDIGLCKILFISRN